jgi:hypothetical protein
MASFVFPRAAGRFNKVGNWGSHLVRLTAVYNNLLGLWAEC